MGEGAIASFLESVWAEEVMARWWPVFAPGRFYRPPPEVFPGLEVVAILSPVSPSLYRREFVRAVFGQVSTSATGLTSLFAFSCPYAPMDLRLSLWVGLA